MSFSILSKRNTKSRPIERYFQSSSKSFAVFLLLSLWTLSGAGCFLKQDSFSDRVVLKVNDEALLAKDFAESLADKLRIYDALTVKDEKVVNRIKETVINDFIVQKVTEQFAKRNGILVRKEDLEAEINSIRAYYPDDLAFRNALAEQNLSFQEWSQRLKSSLLQKLVMQKLKEEIEGPSTEELKTFYENNKDLFKQPEQIKISQIVLKNENDAKQILEELKSGKKFEDLAQEYSIAPEAFEQGNLGWVEKGTLEVFDKVFDLRKGKRSGILKSPYGYHIIEVHDKRSERLKSFEEVKDIIARRILEKKEQATYSQWLEFEIKNAKVFRDDALIEAIQVETKN